ncbi:MAG TPA: HPr family phosphocarrier protein [Candidatus Galloscillospira stercoripullorum]|nr:HPr family phosphocarrier protein [Candidatus Galloscillospira stercoripullorum]
MHTCSLSLGSVAQVKLFVDAASRYPCEIDVLSGRYVVDAKSILGLLSLDLTKPVSVEFHGDGEQFAAFLADIAPFRAEV